MEIKPIIEKLRVFEARIQRSRESSKIDSRRSPDTKVAEISEEAKQIQRIRKMIDEMPDVRPEVEELVCKLTKEIEDGTYLKRVSGRDIVDKIIERLSER
jgi:anti-sigma28 factor (negative regulator of flagellin synthesis)